MVLILMNKDWFKCDNIADVHIINTLSSEPGRTMSELYGCFQLNMLYPGCVALSRFQLVPCFLWNVSNQVLKTITDRNY